MSVGHGTLEVRFLAPAPLIEVTPWRLVAVFLLQYESIGDCCFQWKTRLRSGVCWGAGLAACTGRLWLSLMGKITIIFVKGKDVIECSRLKL